MAQLSSDAAEGQPYNTPFASGTNQQERTIGAGGEAAGTLKTKHPERGDTKNVSPPQTPHSPRGFGSRPGKMLSNSGIQASETSRPQSAISKRSITYAPSITSQAFFRPMSSQRLQAQRGSRPFTGANEPVPDVPRLSTSTINRPSLEFGSGMAQRDGPASLPSRGTEGIGHNIQDRAYYNSSPTGANTIRTGDSSQPLNDTSRGFQSSSHANQRIPVTPQTPHSYSASPDRSVPPQAPAVVSQASRVFRDATSNPFAEKQMSSERTSAGRNYEHFSGNTVFCWGGRFQNTKHRPVNIFTALLIVVPTALFFAFSAPWLWHHVSPAIPVVFAYLFYICFSSFLHASITDPGILPRNLHPLPPVDTDDPLAIGPSLSDWTMVKSKNPNMTAMDVPSKYCKTCNVWRPLRAHHCRLCDSCIETQDHHCVWLNNCVGRRNYRYFFAFISSAVVLGLFLALASLGHCIAFSTQTSISFREAIDQKRIPFAMFLYGILILPYPVSLLGYHLFLTGRAETTREYLNSHKFLPKDRHRPFDRRSLVANWATVLLRPRTPGYLQFKSRYIVGDPRFGPNEEKENLPGDHKEGGLELRSISDRQTATGLSR